MIYRKMGKAGKWLLFLAMSLWLANEAVAATYFTFKNTAGDNLWRTPQNWSPTRLPAYLGPGLGDYAFHIYSDRVLIVDALTNAEAETVDLGGIYAGLCVLSMTGGTLTTHAKFSLGGQTNAPGQVNMSGGTINAGGYFRLADRASGVLEMTGALTGTVLNTDNLYLGGSLQGATGLLKLYGGTVNINPGGVLWFNYKHANSWGADRIDLKNGKETAQLVISDNLVSNEVFGNVIERWISAGCLTAYDGTGTVCYDYNITNPGKTTVWGILP